MLTQNAFFLLIDPTSCSVLLFKLYKSKLNPGITSLWQKSRSKVNYSDGDWYEPRVVGRDQLERYMKINLTKNVKLDGDYTNHSIRATVISTLDNAGYEARHIMAISSHKSEATIKEYATKCPENKRKDMFQTLSSALTPKAKKPKITATVTSDTDSKTDSKLDNIDINFPTFQLEEMDQFDTLDDAILQDLLSDMPYETENINPNVNALAVQNPINSPVNPPKTKNIQQNTVTNTVNNQNRYPRMPQMVFNNSNITINYNFGK